MFKFDFAISYAGEEVGIAKDLYQILHDKGVNVFFSENEKDYLLGKNLKSELDYIFGPYTKFAVAIVSKHYIQKHWTKYEFNRSIIEQRKRGYEFILPVRLDDAVLEGLKDDVVYIDLRKEGLLETVEIMMKKLRSIYSAEEVRLPKVWVATFGLIIEDILETNKLPDSVPQDYPYLCNWLENDLINRLYNGSVKEVKLLEDERDGEILSVRVGFKWDPDKCPLDLGDIGWWELLELVEFEEIYVGQNWKDVFENTD